MEKYSVSSVNGITASNTGDVLTFLSKTKAEMDVLISTNGLIPGNIYRISGVHPTLYNDGTNSGTVIFLKALTTSELSKEGHGEFYNPKYDQAVSGLGVWSDKSTWIVNYSIFASATGSPKAIAIDNSGNVYTANGISNNVTKITPDGTATTFATGIDAESITIDTSGNVYIANHISNNVTKITPGGTTTTLGTTGTGPVGITVDNLGNVYTANGISNNVTKITPGGTSSILGTTINQPRAITVDSLGNIYTANLVVNKVIKITPGGTSSVFATTGGMPIAITIDSSDNIYTANYGANNVSKITPGGTSSILGTTGQSPSSITVDLIGNVYTCNNVSNNVSKITPSGVSSIIGTGRDLISIVSDGIDIIYVVSGISNNIYKFIPSVPENFLFDSDEAVTADNGAHGNLFKILSMNSFINDGIDSSLWLTAKSITGDITGAFSYIKSAVPNGYTMGSNIIWGGYSWTNVNGNIGTSTDILNLDTEWVKNEYDLTNYNKVIDIIEYDYTNDWISRRYEVEGDNDVIFTKNDNNWFINDSATSNSAISVFMFGNVVGIFDRGLMNNKIKNSYCENINFCGRQFDSNTLTNNSYFSSNILIGYCVISKNTLISSNSKGNIISGNISNNNLFESSGFINNIIAGSVGTNILTISSFENNTVEDNGYIAANILNQSSFIGNILRVSSNISYNKLIFSGFTNNTLINDSFFHNNILENSNFETNILSNGSYFQVNVLSSSIFTTNTLSDISYFNENILTMESSLNQNTLTSGSYFYSNKLEVASIYISNNLTSSYFRYNLLSANSVIGNCVLIDCIFESIILLQNSAIDTSPLTSKQLIYTTLENASIGGDISASTILFGLYPKTVYRRPDNNIKLRYYDNTDILIITDITT